MKVNKLIIDITEELNDMLEGGEEIKTFVVDDFKYPLTIALLKGQGVKTGFRFDHESIWSEDAEELLNQTEYRKIY